MRLMLALPFVIAACDGNVTQPATNPPPPWGVPISGGTMIVTKSGHAVIADPDRDRLLVVDLSSDEVITDLALQPGDEPGRLVEDGAGRIHVALRRGNAVATLASATAKSVERRPACSEPRGIAWDTATDTLHVACATGELVSMPAGGGAITRTLRLERDLRDVIVEGDHLLVTRFRAAELLQVDAAGAVTSRVKPPNVKRQDFSGGGGEVGLVDAIPAVVWRAIPISDNRILMVHQRQLQTKLDTRQQGGYGGGCGAAVEASLTTVRTGEAPFAVSPPIFGALPVDIAVDPLTNKLAVAVAGAKQVQVVELSELFTPSQDGQCGFQTGATFDDQLGAPTSVAYASNGRLVIFYPEVPALVVYGGPEKHTIALPGGLGYDSGRNLFHGQTGVGLACASCHPEGRDDGLVWDFLELGKRRTQNLSGGILARAPYHWNADEPDLPVLMDDVFANRMAGGPVTRSQKLSLGPWLDRLPVPAAPPPLDPAAVTRGKELFDSPYLACTTCHAGEYLTNNKLANVGTGAMFKVPSLRGVGARAPYMHDGCAATLADRFGSCGGGDAHGATSTLTPEQRADLVSYLDSL